MAQNSKPRHSKSTRKPVTIDLEADAVKPDTESPPESKASPVERKDDAGKTAATMKSTPQVKPAASGESSKKTEEPQKPAASAATAEKQDDKTAKASETSGKPAGPAQAAQTAKPSATTGVSGGDKTAQSAEKGGKPSSSGQPYATAPRKPAGQGGGAGRLAAGLIGGVVALALAGGLQWAGVLPGLNSASGSVSASDLAQIRESISALESRAGSDAASVTGPLDTRIRALEDKISAAAPENGTIADLKKQVSELASRVKATGAAGPDDALTAKLAGIEKSQTDLQAALDQTGNTIKGLASRIDTLQTEDKKALQALDTRLSSVEKSLAGPREDIKVARALAAAGLKSAIDRGGSFMAELEAYASIEGTSDAVNQLRSLAASGVPTQAQLLSEFSSKANGIIQTAEGGGSGDGVWNRLLDSASSLVKVRQVGEVSGDSPEAIVARIENRLKNGNLQGAVDEWNTLPKAAQDASADFISQLKARILADKLVAGMLTDAMPGGSN